MSRHGRSLRRKPAGKSASRRVLVCFEGDVTERLYVNGLRKILRRHPVYIEQGSANGEPLKLVRGAIARMKEVRSGDAYDDVWCLFDVETPPHGSLDAALSLAAKNNINCAVSNPCFELWLLLHVTSCNRYMTTSDMIECATRELPSYSGKSFAFEDFEGFIEVASIRSMELEKRYGAHEKVQRKNPSTSVWKFIRVLEEHGGFDFASRSSSSPGPTMG
ncbi:RloB family protein [Streptomyces sp. ST2-7A]|uniref:RloB family protein n=1 Tax=Streptomyces sp. ST2-7A TaxID=2907214 RepID=UPI001F2D4637|nr:RloB family protein [Streptomyces sp. ST2-7A]MCE7079837.1 RloB family protein [Streptomyces sp. ST2-7A]